MSKSTEIAGTLRPTLGWFAALETAISLRSARRAGSSIHEGSRRRAISRR
jgi:hypothetical protein